MNGEFLQLTTLSTLLMILTLNAEIVRMEKTKVDDNVLGLRTSFLRRQMRLGFVAIIRPFYCSILDKYSLLSKF